MPNANRLIFNILTIFLLNFMVTGCGTTSQSTENPMNPSKKWTDVLTQWGELSLQKIQHFSGSNTFHEPPPTFTPTIDSLQALAQKLTQLAPPKTADLSEFNTLDPATFKQGEEIVISGKVKLLPNSNLWQKNISFIITESHTTLDCQGALMSSTDDKKTAIIIRTPTGASEGIHDITVKNCYTSGYNHGLLIEQQTPPNQRYEQLQQGKTTLDEQRKLSPHDIRIEHLAVAHSRNSGIFVGDHVQNVQFYGVGVVASGTVGLYFEFGSSHNEVSHSYFSQNGFRQVTVAGVGVGKPNREAIAIDSSAHNVIANNEFDHNGAGGVFLYRNCFEHADDPTQANHFLRTQGSDGNVIQGNSFVREPVGVWIAARQSRNLKGFECGAYTISETLLTSYHLDEAEYNTVTHNQFDSVENAVIVEDDNNVVSKNTFSPSVKTPISIGSSVREVSSEGVVKGNQINQNTFGAVGGIRFVGKSATANLHCGNMTNNGQKIDDICLVN